MPADRPVRILFVCTGNICRSPTAEGVFRALVAREGLDHEIEADSAGTHGYHIGEPPDPRTVAAAAARDINISSQRARKITRADFGIFNYVLAMDEGHLSILRRMAPAGADARLGLFLDFAPGLEGCGVPDPYYGEIEDFERVAELVELGAAGLLAHIRVTFL